MEDELEKPKGRVTHYCPTCKGWMDIVLHDYDVCEQGVTVTLSEIPLLFCAKCEVIYLPDRAQELLQFTLDNCKSQGLNHERVRPNSKLTQMRFPYCEQVSFIYSGLDCEYLPGLRRPWNPGKLTPVFFKSSCLNKYSQTPGYNIDLFSNTYGTISKGEEISIAFGINRTGKVLMWLGDIDELPLEEQYYLRSENVASDHDVCSEFYDGQIECVFTEPSAENRVIYARSELNQACMVSFGQNIFKLPDEIGKTIEDLHRPVFWNEKAVARPIESFNRILVESLDVAVLNRLLAKRLQHDPEELKSLKGLKLLEKYLADCLGDPDSSGTMLPLFVLNDCRLLVCHLCSNEGRQDKLEAINERLGLAKGNESLELIYFAVLEKLTGSLNSLRHLVTKKATM